MRRVLPRLKALPWGEIIPEAVGLAAYAVVVRGIYGLAGADWAMIAAGAPLLGAYAVREWRAVMPPRKEE